MLVLVRWDRLPGRHARVEESDGGVDSVDGVDGILQLEPKEMTVRFGDNGNASGEQPRAFSLSCKYKRTHWVDGHLEGRGYR